MKLTYLTTLLVLFQGVQVGHATNFVDDSNSNTANWQSIVGRLKGSINHFDYDGASITGSNVPLPLKDSLTDKQAEENLNTDSFYTGSITKTSPLKSQNKNTRKSGVSLSQAIELALGFHPDVSSAKANYRRSQANTASSQTSWYPKVSFDGSGGYSESGKSSNGSSNVGVSANQLIYDFGKTPSEIQYSKNKENQNFINVDASMEDIAARVAEAFVTVNRAEQSLDAADEYITALERIRGMITLRNSAGISDSADMILSQVRLDGVKSDRLASEANLITARSTLSNLTGTQVDNVIISDKERTTLGTDTKLSDIDSHPSIKAAQFAYTAAQEQTKYAKAQSYPSLGVRGNYSYDPIKNKETSSLMLNVSGNLSLAGENKARISAAYEDEQAARLQIESLRITQKTRFMSADENEKSAMMRLSILKEQLIKAREARDLYTLQYQLGKRPLFELLDAEQQVYSANLSIVAATNDLLQAKVEKAQSTGSILKNLNIITQ